MLDLITYKTKIEDLIDIDKIDEIMDTFLDKMENNYYKDTLDNLDEKVFVVKEELEKLAKEQRQKELNKLEEKVLEKINLIEKEINSLQKDYNHIEHNLDEQEKYEYEEILKVRKDEKKRYKDKLKDIYLETNKLKG